MRAITAAANRIRSRLREGAAGAGLEMVSETTFGAGSSVRPGGAWVTYPSVSGSMSSSGRRDRAWTTHSRGHTARSS
jgi:hypothetical protein